MTAQWHVIKTEPQAEYLAASELDHDGFEVFLPCVKVTYSRRGHLDTPIFPGYLFLRHDPETAEWPTFRAGHRILGWVKFGGEVPSLPDEIVFDIKKRVEAINSGGGIWQQFQPGERVEIASKSVQSLGEVIEAARSPQGRVKVLMDFMGRKVSAEVPWEILKPVGSSVQTRQTSVRRTRGKGRWISGQGSPAGVFQ